MVTDRASTACLCIVLGALYPQYVAGLCSLIMLDLFSHWYHTSATRTGTHKKSSNWLVNVYYSRKVLFTVCAATELWYMSLYMTDDATAAARGMAEMAPIKLGELVDKPQAKRIQLVERAAEEDAQILVRAIHHAVAHQEEAAPTQATHGLRGVQAPNRHSRG